MTQTDAFQKRGAHAFLDKLKTTLDASVPARDVVRKRVREIAAASKFDEKSRHSRYPETAFLNTYIIQEVFDLLETYEGIGKAEARQSLLAEGFKNFPDLSSGTPARTVKHPFSKLLSAGVKDVAEKWREGNVHSLTQACPDFALRTPFPHKIVFEGKYFEQGSPDKASRDLATNIYQAFFYRALPYVAPKGSGPAWDYDFACLLAYDASPNATLKSAWDNLSPQVKIGFWEGANVYVMILGATG